MCVRLELSLRLNRLTDRLARLPAQPALNWIPSYVARAFLMDGKELLLDLKRQSRTLEESIRTRVLPV